MPQIEMKSISTLSDCYFSRVAVYIFVFSTLVTLCSCKGNDILFLGDSVDRSLPSEGVEQHISELLPPSVDIVCNFGPYTDILPEGVPEKYREAIEKTEIFPVSEVEGYFIYLTKSGSVVASDRINYRSTGYSWDLDDRNGKFRCEGVSAVKVGNRSVNGRSHLYLTKY